MRFFFVQRVIEVQFLVQGGLDVTDYADSPAAFSLGTESKT